MANEFVARNGVIALDDSQITGSLIVTDGITGSLFGTSSWATDAITATTASYFLTSSVTSASYALNATNASTASYVETAQTASYVLNAISASYSDLSLTASYANNVNTGSLTGSFVTLDTTQSISGVKTFNPVVTVAASTGATGSALILTGSVSASANNQTLVGLDVRPNFNTGAFTGVNSYALRVAGNVIPSVTNTYNLGSGTFLWNTITATNFGAGNGGYAWASNGGYKVFFNNGDFVVNLPTEVARFTTTKNLLLGTTTDNGYRFSSIASTTSSGSIYSSGSNVFNGNTTITGSLTVSGSITSTGTLTAQTLVVTTVSSSVVYSSGSNIFGNSLTNTQVFTGSVNITGSLNLDGIAAIGTTTTSAEGNLFLGAKSTSEGGQLFLQKGTNYNSASMLDNYQDTFRVLSGTDTTSNRMDLELSHVTQNLRIFGDVIAYAASDKRLKENVQPIENALDKLDKINGYTFDWNDKIEIHGHEGHDIGVIAQEIEEVLPEAVTTRDNGYKAVKYEKLTAYLIQVDKEQQEIIKDQQRQINELKELINIYIKTK